MMLKVCPLPTLIFFLSLPLTFAWAQEADVSPKPLAPSAVAVSKQKPSDRDAKIEETLRHLTTTDFYEQPLSEAVLYFAETHQIPIVIDRNALFEYGLSDESQVSLAVKDVPLETALKLVLEQMKLTYLVEDGVIKIIPSQLAPERTQLKIYDLPLRPDATLEEGQSLLAVIRTIDPYHCEDSHTVQFLAGKIVLIADYQTHKKVKEFFEKLKDITPTASPDKGPSDMRQS